MLRISERKWTLLIVLLWICVVTTAFMGSKTERSPDRFHDDFFSTKQ